ncbi:cilia- and flagella-associated protein 298 [Agrilus planipennis]|uniref:Cilia- and flagella-associated protein 298 n=1 Tax=Agrilus planipennis TaxID=224129 RepID=A0A1W4W6W6_AGRPL|nr:cilia- and flagella-associated protein 298 [Agrilus planipennis]
MLTMVLIYIKRNDQNKFIYETCLNTKIDDLAQSLATIYNGCLKVDRICGELEELAKYGTLYPPEILGLTEEQVKELKREDYWGERCIPSGGYDLVKDPIGRRNGKQPKKDMQDLLNKTIKEAKDLISPKILVPQGIRLTMKVVQQAIDLLRGAVMIVYPMKLPPHDVIRMELENIEDLSGTQASLEVIDPASAQLWFCGKEMYRDGKTLRDYVGKIENCKVTIKLSKRGEGPPAREPIMSEEQRKQLMAHAFRKQEELKKLEMDEDDSYLNSEWADNNNLKRTFHGLNNIYWKPGKK